MTQQKITLNGHEFTSEPLEPFGELWKPTSSLIDISELVDRNIGKIVETVRSRQLIVFEKSEVPDYWFKVKSEPSTCLPHVDFGGGDILLLHMLHSVGPRKPTLYTTQNYLENALREKMPFLEQLVLKFSSDLCRRMDVSITPILDAIKTHGQFDFGQILRRILSAQKKCLTETNIAELRSLYDETRAFFLEIAKDVRKYTHVWDENPHTTVVAYQNPLAISKKDVVYHFASDFDVSHNKNLRRNLVSTSNDDYNWVWG